MTTPMAAPAVVGPKLKRATRPTEKLPQYLIDDASKVEKSTFDASKHLNIAEPERIYTMKEIGLEGAGISTTAASAPFSLFTAEAVQQMRHELFSQPVLESCQYTSDFAKNMIRGFGPALAPFIFDAWHSPEVLNAVSKIAGVDLVPALDFEVGHINISINATSTEIVQNKDGNYSKSDDMSAFAWHRDSYPFVCVTMLSDCTGMVGGETAMRTGSGEVMKVRGPTMGTAVVMQGRYIEHQALKALGGRERISMVTAFRPKSVLVKDEIVLTGPRPISNLPELYGQYSQYRFEVLEERIRNELKKMRDRERSKRQFDTAAMRDFIADQKQYLEAMLLELVD
ncbi:hypothetical protein B0T10DRAFT_533403 [Thelonectria olida]|uniref:Fe2OG dioxygenase domain-containing protein n=1 Tax=Thelonectria olida TaxID=1576542 RepID=A0A9P8VRY4_9HYPO|nr:hypothetical protein B0T10DRAFT_533403 [Thelonectria olida]